MRNLTKIPSFTEREFKTIARRIGVADLPKNFKEILGEFGGHSIIEKYIFNKDKNIYWTLHGFYKFIGINRVLQTMTKLSIESKYCPFAYDEGGHIFCISLEHSDNPVYIFNPNGIDKKEMFIEVAVSFEKFIMELSEELPPA